MKKTQFALAALALVASTAALAHGATVYGTIDASMAKGSSSETMFSGAGQMGTSVFGMRGSEDLGNGLSANFNLEAGINAGNGNIDNGGPGGSTGLFTRFANAGLSGGFGSVTGGLQLSPFILSYVTSLGLAGNNFLVPTLVNAGAADGGGAGVGATGGFFIPNAISYTSPDLGGATVSLMTATGNGSDLNKYTGANVRANFGDLYLTIGYADRKNSYQNTVLGTAYTMGALKVAASYIMGSPAAATKDINTYTVGASYAIDAANTIGLNYSKNNAAQAASIVNVTASHALSKSTSLYAFYNNTKNSALSSYYNTSGDNAYGIGITKNF
jgi:predicted porin